MQDENIGRTIKVLLVGGKSHTGPYRGLLDGDDGTIIGVGDWAVFTDKIAAYRWVADE